jgi:hypothetical protein
MVKGERRTASVRFTVRKKNGKARYRLRIWKLALTVEFPSSGRKP